ncbi:Alpha/Beta hydrolase protein [Talaromyces proteolyticus]|uniref:Alpha/Beta hydrolase protein n=1 Tax=Talaromyces proteolyticus TaxID=1131652 RepID=A0AAD4KUL6_9EURO|nr:Alpha/Beta hydrolase protein [Talaromyces proteolyticus]KAH8701518.1 Alpha/Beta hydrolase protein [Talaromyces proteolyticus]
MGEIQGLAPSWLLLDRSVSTKDINISGTLSVRVYQPPRINESDSLPLALYAHGGGWAFGGLDDDDALCRFIARTGPMVVVSVKYRLAPEYPFPAALEDCIDTIRWVNQHSEELNANSASLVTVGQSAGGNLAIATALKCLENDIAHPIGVVAIVPITCHPDHCPRELARQYTSYEENAYTPMTAATTMRSLFDLYSKSPEDPYISVLLHSNLSKMPKTYIAISEKDTLRDDGRLLKKRLDEYGVPNRCDEYIGQPHYFHTMPSKHLRTERDLFYKNLAKGLKFVLM